MTLGDGDALVASTDDGTGDMRLKPIVPVRGLSATPLNTLAVRVQYDCNTFERRRRS
jgi:hypothetical protein